MACACRRVIELDCHPQQEPSTHPAHEVTAGDSDRLPQIRESGQGIFKAFHAKARESTFPMNVLNIRYALPRKHTWPSTLRFTCYIPPLGVSELRQAGDRKMANLSRDFRGCGPLSSALPGG